MGARKVLFVDRDGTLITEPPDEQIDTLEKLELVDGVMPALLRLRDAGWSFVIVTNQDGLGTSTYPQAAWELVQAKMLRLFASQGITFADTLVCPHRPADGCTCRKPHLGLVRPWLARGEVDMSVSAVVGDRDTDLALATNMGLRGFKVGPAAEGRVPWLDVARELVARPRRARRRRVTNETTIEVAVELDREAPVSINTGIGFFDHMLDQIARHGGFGLEIVAKGDLHVDEHHTVEDVAIALGEALREALGDKVGAGRYGFVLPMDESLGQAAIDLSGRPYFVLTGQLPRDKIGGLSTEMVVHFFRSLATALGAALHLEVRGENTHHQIEALFKVVGRALRPALAKAGGGVPSTKGVL
jgi:imidazoleglycerol-phosphate dehydratase/histidinol-phosphatase